MNKFARQIKSRAVRPSCHHIAARAKKHRPGAISSNHALQAMLHNRAIQAKLTINEPGDKYEQEADRVADQVMRMGEGRVQQSRPPAIQRLCPECEEEMQHQPIEEEEEMLQPKERVGNAPTLSSHIAHQIQGLRGGGRPLSPPTRHFFESRFGHDFSHVRVHTGARAAQTAAAVNARAFTRGHDLVFAAGQFNPDTWAGRTLIAHELTHVIQQNGRDTAPVQRACGSRAIGTQTDCRRDQPVFVPGHIFRFDINCDEFATGQDAALAAFVRGLPPAATFKIHGYASVDRLVNFNWNLACARAKAAHALMTMPGPIGGGIPATQISQPINHGPTPGPAIDRRSVVIETSVPPEPEPEKPFCGPDATDWFVRQVNAAMRDTAVLDVQTEMASADSHARAIGLRATQAAESGATLAVLREETALGSAAPPRNPTITAQLALGGASVAAVTHALRTRTSFSDRIHAARMAFHLGQAALKWKALVDHAARYDFKAHTDSMRNPRSPNCPEEGCPPGEVGIITLCPGSSHPENCYESDLPGNLFYALIGKHVGWSELTLQLGSQMAELTDVTPRPARPRVTWDTPDDTAAIHLGFGLPLPLTRAALCGAVSPARSSLARRAGCKDCSDPTPSRIR